MKRLLFFAVLVAGCTFDPDLGDNYFPCKPNGTCPEGCDCLEGLVCVPTEYYDINDCAWCPEGYEPCYNPEKPDERADCVDTKFDLAHCSECNQPCVLPNATSDCIEGICVIIDCLDCYVDCDQLDETGCETCPETDPNNCGECGNVCDDPPPPVCEGDDQRIYLDTGDCISSACDYPSSLKACAFGCENDYCIDDPCTGVTCSLHQRCEGGICVCENLYGDCDTNNLNGCETYLSAPENCGECGFSCGDKGICTGGVCDCDYGFGNCDDNWATGCETDVLLDEMNCGECGIPCDTSLTCCGGACVDTDTDRGNCGRCNLFCSGLTECCLGTCTDVQLNPENCGSCGNICRAPNSTCCYTVCVDTINDAGNCGECGNGCAIYMPCHQGACGNQGIFCGDTPCDFWQEECCYGAAGIGCYPTGTCSTRRVECDDASDCGDSLYCCLVNNSQYITQCTASCPDPVCSSDAYCVDVNPAAPYCCAGNFFGQNVNTCTSEICQ